MRQETILFPVFALAALTFFVALWMARLRFAAVKKGDLDARYYRLNRGAEPPDYLVKVSRNFDNLLQIPVLFYVGALVLYAAKRVDVAYVALAWLYVGTRFAHTYIHTTYNDVRHRMIPFLFGGVVLMAIWVRLFLQIVQG